MKVLMLILSSPDVNPIYKLHKSVWLKYMNLNQNIDCFFIEHSPNEEYLDGNILIKGNTVFIKGVESQHPGCKTKTFACFDYFLNKIKDISNNCLYDYIIRTNMSSLWNFNALINYLKTLPTKNVYSGAIGYCTVNNVYFASGSGMIMTPDIVQLIINNKTLADECNYQDDVDIGFILKKLGIHITHNSRTDIYSMDMFNNYTYDNNVYHYRIKWNNTSLRVEEPTVMLKILDMINSSIA